MTENNLANDARTEWTMWHWPLLVIGGIVIAVAGFAVGRAYPANHYEHLGTSVYLFNVSTGKLCAPYRDSEDAYQKWLYAQIAPGNAVATVFGASGASPKAAADMIPSCGSE